VDNTSGAATDSANPNGWPAKPRATIPGDVDHGGTALPAGAVVEVHGGPYNYNVADGLNQVTANGTSGAGTVYIVGIADGGGNKPAIQSPVDWTSGGSQRQFWIAGSYYVLDGLRFSNYSLQQVLLRGDHGVIRNSECVGFAAGDETSQTGGPCLQAQGDHHVIYNNLFKDNANGNTASSTTHYLSAHDNKVNGIKVGGTQSIAATHHVWILNNTFFHNGQAMQFGDDCVGTIVSGHCQVDAAALPHHFYIGFNTMHDDREVGIALKMVSDFIVSQNTVYNYVDLPAGANCGTSPTITAINAGRFYSDYVWVLFNTIYNTSEAIRSNDTQEGFSGSSTLVSHFYAMGNLIHDVVSTTSGTGANCAPYNATDAQGAGVALVGFLNDFVYMIDNTIVNATKGISPNGVGSYQSTGNLLVNTGDPMAFFPVGFGGTNVFDYNFYDGTARLAYSSTTPIISLATMQGNGQDTHSLQGTSGVGITGAVTAVSPVVAANSSATRTAAYDTFFSRYGIDIKKDFNGRARPSGAWTIGALEPVLATIIISGKTALGGTASGH
jgi:hypothetical protein